MSNVPSQLPSRTASPKHVPAPVVQVQVRQQVQAPVSNKGFAGGVVASMPVSMPGQMLWKVDEVTNNSFDIAGEFVDNAANAIAGVFLGSTGAVHTSGQGMVILANNITNITLDSMDGSMMYCCNNVEEINSQVIAFLARILVLCESQFSTFFRGVGDVLANSGSLGDQVAVRCLDAGRIFATTAIDMSAFISERLFQLFIVTAMNVQNGSEFGFDVCDRVIAQMTGLGQIQDHAMFASNAARGGMQWITTLSASILSEAQTFVLSVLGDSHPLAEAVFSAVHDMTRQLLVMFKGVGDMSNAAGSAIASGAVDFFAQSMALVRNSNAAFWKQARDANGTVFGALRSGRDIIFPWIAAVWDQTWGSSQSFVMNGMQVGVTGCKSTMYFVNFFRRWAWNMFFKIFNNSWDLVFKVFDQITFVGIDCFACANKVFLVDRFVGAFNHYDDATLKIRENVVVPVINSVKKADMEIFNGETFRRAGPMLASVGAQ